MDLSLLDYSGNNNTLTCTGTAYNTSLPFATNNINAVNFTGSQYATAEDSASLSIAGSVTVQCWVNWDSLPTNTNEVGIISKFTDTANSYGYHLGLYNSGGCKLHAHYQPSTTWVENNRWSEVWVPDTGVWYHVACVFNMATPSIQFFVNGSALAAAHTSTDTSINNSTAKLSIGAVDNASKGYAQARFDDVRIYNVARSEANIAADRSQRITSFTNVAAYYPFDPLLSATTNSLKDYRRLSFR